jgi:hypothetical protein
MKLKIIISFLILALNWPMAQAQIITPAKWTYQVSKTEVKAGETIELVFRATLDKNWYMYSSDFDPNLGPLLSVFSFKAHPSYELVGKITPVGAKRKYSEIFEGDYTYFLEKAEFRQKVKILKKNPVIEVEHSYQVCSDIDGKCISFEADHAFNNINVTEAIATPAKETDKGVQPKLGKEDLPKGTTPPSTTSVRVLPQNLEVLFKERQKYIVTDHKGQDKSVNYLRSFVRKYGDTN